MKKFMIVLMILWALTACTATSTPETIAPTRTAVDIPTTAPEPTTAPTATTEIIPTAVPTLPPATPTDIPPTPVPQPPASASSHSNSPVIANDGRLIAFVSTGKLTDDAPADGRWAAYVSDRETGQTRLISKTLDGHPVFDNVYEVALSGNGRYAAFYSFDSHVTATDDDTCTAQQLLDGCEDLFVVDLESNTIRRIDTSGVTGLGKTYTVHISDDGNLVTYVTDRNMIVQHDFARDTAVSLADSLNLSAPYESYNSFAISPNGDIAFVTTEALAAGDNNGRFDVYLSQFNDDPDTIWISAAADGTAPTTASGITLFHEGAAPNLDISDDGRFIVFGSNATNLTAAETHTCTDYFQSEERPCANLYLYDRETGTTRILTNGNADSTRPSISGDGRLLAFSSAADDLIPGLFNCEPDRIWACSQIYLLDLETGELTLVTTAEDGQVGNNSSFAPQLSSDGRWLTFSSSATNLAPNVAEGGNYIYVYGRETGEISLLQN